MRALQRKVAVITRGNSGIELAVAKGFVVEDALVFTTGRRPVSSARRSSSYIQRVSVVSGGRGPSADSAVPVNFGTDKWTHASAQNGPTQVTIGIVAWDMRSRRTLLWKMILAAAALKGRKACAQPADARVREIGKQALSGPFAGMEASLVEVSYPPGERSAEHRHPGFIVGYVLEEQIRFAINHETPRLLRRGEMFYEPMGALHSTSENAQPGMPAKILAFMVAPPGRPVVEGK
jgi:quercetin dioxygenase-like cupin family protein